MPSKNQPKGKGPGRLGDEGEAVTYPVPDTAGPDRDGYRMDGRKGDEMRYHGAMPVRGLASPRSIYYDSGRFGRLFNLRPFAANASALRRVGGKGGPMDPTGKDNPENEGIPAGFTFLGQFIDHDITFDPTSSLDRQVDPESIRNFRTPNLELDSVYGAGPGANPFLYQKGNRDELLIGADDSGEPRDLPRNQEDVALIGDPRNDENQIVAQLQLAFLKFHNAVVDRLDSGDLPLPHGTTTFEEAQRLVRWHYQWIVSHEFLDHICGKKLAEEVRTTPRRYYRWRNEPYIPVEFSVAAYRFGHSQVRQGYRLNSDFGAAFFSQAGPDLRGGRRLPAQRVIDWSLFFSLDGSRPQPSMAIDTQLSPPLFDLPGASGREDDPISLAERNLLRHLTFGLPSGQAVAQRMGEEPLSGSDLAELQDEGMHLATPLWYYVLKEAEHLGEGKHLGPVGGRIVAEVLIGLLDGDNEAYRKAAPQWQPTLGDGDFTMADLLRIANVAG